MLLRKNIYGELVSRTISAYPYSFDPVATFKRDWKETDNVVFSDKLMDEDYDRFGECCMAVFQNKSQSFDRRDTLDINRFLSMYLGKDVLLTGIEICCNVSNGYPYWAFYYRET